ncbi:hypothetical protein AB0G87_00060 [Streptomyces asoensis]|uniref:hypothetical protein n=1 Tax=Streptomyces asoensis TaxID=249586 RepID=UPI0033E07416
MVKVEGHELEPMAAKRSGEVLEQHLRDHVLTDHVAIGLGPQFLDPGIDLLRRHQPRIG